MWRRRDFLSSRTGSREEQLSHGGQEVGRQLSHGGQEAENSLVMENRK
jgi:hypothetical protein